MKLAELHLAAKTSNNRLVSVDQSCSVFRRNFGSFFPQSGFSSQVFSWCEGLSEDHSTRISLGLRSELWPGPDSWRWISFVWHHCVESLLWGVASRSCWTLQLLLRFSRQTTPWHYHGRDLVKVGTFFWSVQPQKQQSSSESQCSLHYTSPLWGRLMNRRIVHRKI